MAAVTRVSVTYTRDQVLRLLERRETEMRSGSVPVLATVAAQRVADALNDAVAGGFTVDLDWSGRVDVNQCTVLRDVTGRWVVDDTDEPS